MKHILCLLVTLALSPAAFAADPSDAKALRGSWTPVEAQLAGQPVPDAVLKSINLKVANGTYLVTVEGGREPDKGTYTLDSAANPKGMTVISTNGPNRGKTFPAIYELKGDTLRVCYDLSGAKRPAAFKSVADTQLFLVTYHRKKQ
ncbi:MAG TPA: TIGR03067 domain-containing protein [Candidatus Binatia bacterium]|jgi:uncharacterized protein (TIGR03067 family)|nr:TIGR03067 domain-containing protein [Candidatus Binatia bacterium]